MTQPHHDYIEHIPNERRDPKWLWKAAWLIVALFWLLQLRHGFNWDSLALGGITGMVLVAWSMQKTGGEVPASWRKSARRR